MELADGRFARAMLDASFLPGPVALDPPTLWHGYDAIFTADENQVFVCVPTGSVNGGGCGGIRTASRASTTDPWSDLTVFNGLDGQGPLFGQSFYTPLWVSGDGCTFYYTQEAQTNVFTVEEIRRPPL